MPDSNNEHISIVSLSDKKVVTDIFKIDTKPTYTTESTVDRISTQVSIVAIIGVFLWWLYSGGWTEILTKHYLVIPLTIIGLVLSVLGGILYVLTSRENNQIKITEVNDNGIVLGRLGSSTIYSGCYSIEWKDLKCVDLLQSPGANYLLLESRKPLVYKIRWDKAFDWIDESQLLDAIKTYSPRTIVNLPRIKSITDRDDPRYTQLWLEYFSNPNTRKRKGPLTAGETLEDGAYTIEKQHAQGGQGTVYLAHRASDGQKVIIKEHILPICQGTEIEESQVNSLEHEVKMLSSIEHPGIVTVLDCLIEDHRGYVILEYVNGHSLRDLVKTNGSAPEDAIIDWCLQITKILEYLHNMTPPIVHRDLTPDNLMLEPDGRIKLIDFTIAQHTRATRLTSVSGKQAYMPPEQIKGAVHPANDYYALGCTMYFLMNGYDPTPLAPELSKEAQLSYSQALNELASQLTRLSSDERLTSPTKLTEGLMALKNLMSSSN